MLPSLLTLFLFQTFLAHTEIIQVTKQNFKKFKHETPSILLYYLEGDEDYKEYVETFREAMKEAVQYGMSVGEIDCGNQTSLCKRANLQSIPEVQLRTLENKTFIYEGRMKIDPFISWLDDHLLRKFRIFHDKSEFEAAYTYFEHIYVGYFPNRTCKEFIEFSEGLNTSDFGVLYCALINQSETPYSIEVFHTIYNMRNKLYFTPENFSLEEIRNWIREEQAPLWEEYNSITIGRYQFTNKPIGLYFMKVARTDDDYMNRNMAPIARKYKGRVYFCYVDLVTYPHLHELNGFKYEDIPSFCILENVRSVYGPSQVHIPYLGDEDHPHPSIEAEEIDIFLQKYLNGSLKRTIRSEPPPYKQTRNVTYVVGTTWEEIVMDPTKDVFIRIFPYYEHSLKKNGWEWEHLANETAETPDLVIAELDCARNDFPSDYIIQSYPGILFFPRGNKRMMRQMRSAPTYEGMLNFLRALCPQLIYEEQEWTPMPKEPYEIEEEKRENLRAQWRKEREEREVQKEELEKMEVEHQKMLKQLHKAEGDDEL